VGHCPTHHSGIALHRDHFQPGPAKDIEVCLVDVGVVCVQVGEVALDNLIAGVQAALNAEYARIAATVMPEMMD